MPVEHVIDVHGLSGQRNVIAHDDRLLPAQRRRRSGEIGGGVNSRGGCRVICEFAEGQTSAMDGCSGGLAASCRSVGSTDRHSDAIISVMAEQARSHFVTLSPSRGSITLPAEVRHRHHLDEPGAQVEIVERGDGVIELHPLLPHRADQAWFWAERWQAMEREAQDDITACRVETFNSTDDFLADIEREAADRGVA
jgi:bifunctional DNA-binding transcriptional regulator/antitoxin component of YhaV-PrlF toxin-antitoxin module